MARYGITADELHNQLVDSMAAWLEYFGCPKRAAVLGVEATMHPLEQVVGGLLSCAFMHEGNIRAGMEEAADNISGSQDYADAIDRMWPFSENSD